MKKSRSSLETDERLKMIKKMERQTYYKKPARKERFPFTLPEEKRRVFYSLAACEGSCLLAYTIYRATLEIKSEEHFDLLIDHLREIADRLPVSLRGALGPIAHKNLIEYFD